MLYPDLVQRFLPIDFPGWDRSLGLEEVWQRDWDRQLALRCAAKTRPQPVRGALHGPDREDGAAAAGFRCCRSTPQR